jgi:hypothetical protein
MYNFSPNNGVLKNVKSEATVPSAGPVSNVKDTKTMVSSAGPISDVKKTEAPVPSAGPMNIVKKRGNYDSFTCACQVYKNSEGIYWHVKQECKD